MLQSVRCSLSIALVFMGLGSGFAGEAGPLSHRERRLSFPDHAQKAVLPTELIQGTIVQVDSGAGNPRLLVQGDSGVRQWVKVYPKTWTTTLNSLTPAYLAKAKKKPFYDIAPSQEFYDSDDDAPLEAQTANILRAASPGGGYVQGILVRRLRGDWVAMWLEVELTDGQEAAMTQAFLAGKAQEEAAKQAARDQAETARKAEVESARLEKIAACRAEGNRRPTTGEARKYRILAEDAVREKRFDEAAGYYARALDILPCWPEGHYNLAVIEGELKAYEQAAAHMRWYLGLVPNAKDATAAEDKLILWQEKAKTVRGR